MKHDIKTIYERNCLHLNEVWQRAGRMLKMTDYGSKMQLTSHHGWKRNGQNVYTASRGVLYIHSALQDERAYIH